MGYITAKSCFYDGHDMSNIAKTASFNNEGEGQGYYLLCEWKSNFSVRMKERIMRHNHETNVTFVELL
jgi:hypothetical protein